MATGIFFGLAYEEAFRFSFLLGIPTLLGAAIFALLERGSPESWLGLLLGTSSAFLSGVVSLSVFRLALSRRKLWPFGLYCLLLGTVGLILI